MKFRNVMLLSTLLVALIWTSSAQPPIIVDGDDTDWETLDPINQTFKFVIEDYTWDLAFNPGTGSIDINYASGFDIENGSVFIYLLDVPNVSLYFRLISNGTIGDATGDGDPRNGTYEIDANHTVIEDSKIFDMGSREQYEIKFDYDGDNLADERIIVGDNDQVYWDSDGTSTGLSAAWNGRVLEVGAENVGDHDQNLSALTFRYDMYAGSGEDFWSEDQMPTLSPSPPVADFIFIPSCNGSAQFISTSKPGTGVIVLYNWYFGDGNSDIGYNFTTNHQYATGGLYTVTLNVTNLWGLSNETTKVVTVGNGSVIADAGPARTIVKGNCVVIGGNPTASGGEPPYTYEWTGAGLNNTDISNPEACPTTSTTYRVQVNDSNPYSDKVTCYDFDEIIITVVEPELQVVKSCPPSASAGDTITYDYNVTNTGDVDLNITKIMDDTAGTPAYMSGDNGDGLLSPGESWLYNAIYTVPAGVVSITNNISVTAKDEVTGIELTVYDECTTSIERNPDLKVVKSCPSSASAGDTITYDYNVTNTGDVDLNITKIMDDRAGTPTYVSGDNGDGLLSPGESWLYNAIYTVPAGVVSITNNVSVTAKDEVTGIELTVYDECTTSIERNPDLKVVKSCPSSASAGDTITYDYNVTNTGDVDLNITKIMDDTTGTPTYVSGDNGDGLLNPGESWLYNAIYTVPAGVVSITNNVSVTAKDEVTGTELTVYDECTTPVKEGCVRTQGYWKTHSSYGPAGPEAWSMLVSEFNGNANPDWWFLIQDDPFNTANDPQTGHNWSKTWIEVFMTSPKGGNAWITLGHQYMAAYLNYLSGAAMPQNVQSNMTLAYGLLTDPAYGPDYTYKGDIKQDFIQVYDVLVQYNEGDLGVPHCD